MPPTCLTGFRRVEGRGPSWSVTCYGGVIRGRYDGGRRPSSDDSFHSPIVIPSSALDKPSITKRYHRRRKCSHTSPRRSPMMITLHETRFVECRRLDCENCRHLTVVGLHDTGPISSSQVCSSSGSISALCTNVVSQSFCPNVKSG